MKETESPLTMGGGALNKDSNPDEKEEESNPHDEISELLASIHSNRENIILAAYTEISMQFYTNPNPPTVPGKKDDKHAPRGDLVIPLPLPTHASSDLKKARYSKLRPFPTCLTNFPSRLKEYKEYYGDVWDLNSQISIMQPVAVRMVDEDIVVGGGATKDLWHPGKGVAELFQRSK